MNTTLSRSLILIVAFGFQTSLSLASTTAVTAKKADAVVDSAAPKTAADKTSAKAQPVKDGDLEFFAIGKPSMLKIHGESTKMTGTMTREGNNLSGQLEIPLDSFETGMTVRNNHLKEKVFETTKFQTAKLTISKLAIPEGKTGEIKDLPFTGKLNLHGVDKDISGTATLNVSEASVAFAAEAQVKMSDYQIPPPEFMGMTIQDSVKITAKGKSQL